jgi:ankyrin repeat protein
MNDVPQNGDDSDDIDDRYRRAAAQDPSRPSDAVRRAVFTQAAQLAADRVRARAPAKDDTSARVTPIEPRWRRRPRYLPAVVGTLAAAVLVGLWVIPRVLMSPNTPPPLASSPAAVPVEPTAAPLLPKASEIRPYGATPPTRAAASARARARARQDAELDFNAAGRQASPPDAANAVPASPPSDQRMPQYYAPAVAAAPMPPASGFVAGLTAPATTTAAMTRAAEQNDIPALQTLFDQGIDIDSRDADGRTPLMLAVLNGQSVAVDVLIAHGANVDAADRQGITPLRAAESAHRTDIAAALRRAGAHR